MVVRLTGDQVFWVSMLSLTIWVGACVGTAMATGDAGYVSLVFVPVLFIDQLDRIKVA